MKNKSFVFCIIIYALAVTYFASQAYSQEASYPAGERVVRVKEMTKSGKFGPGGTIVIAGAPEGSISVVGWAKNEVSIEAEIKVFADNETDAARIADVTGFYTDEDVTSFRIYSVGPHDKKYLKKADKKFPKRLRKNRTTVSYTLKVPYYSDLEIDGGSGDFDLNNVEGVIRVNYLKSNARIKLIGGRVQVVIASGSLDCTIATRSWRGRRADIQIASGDLNLRLPKNLNADLEAHVLRNGKINDFYNGLEPMPRIQQSDTYISTRAGNGGAKLAFTVGDGSLNIYDFEKVAQK